MNDGAMPLFFGYNTCWFEGWPGHAWLVIDANMHYSSVQLKHVIGWWVFLPYKTTKETIKQYVKYASYLYLLMHSQGC
jgi:hypothetical protein